MARVRPFTALTGFAGPLAPRGRPGAFTATAVALVLAGQVAAPGGPKDGGASVRGRTLQIIAYVPDYRVATIPLSVGASVTDLIFFSIEPKPTGALNTRRLGARSLRKLHEIRRRYKNRLLVAVGGWGRSSGFAAVATRKQPRQRFVEELTRWCVDHRFDGADFDWEHPANKREEEAYAVLLADVRRAFGPKRLLLSLTLAPWEDPGPSAYAAADRVQVMSYDHEEARHSTLEQARTDVDALVTRGVPRQKLCLGVPLYGRDMKDRNRVVAYGDLMRKYKPAPEVDEVGGIYFNGIGTVRRKARYAKQSGLGGIMIWELGQDTRGETSLLRAVRQALSE